MLGIDYDDLLGAAAGLNGVVGVHGDEYVRCGVCSFGGCDLRIVGCGCTLHARCTKLPSSGKMTACPQCTRPSNELVLLPMSFREIDEARKAAIALANSNRGRKRKSPPGEPPEPDRNFPDISDKSEDRRTGRWTSEEMAYVDAIIEKFEKGQLPVVDGIKLNDFLSNILKSKQSRLTKKMKNAKLSTRAFKRTTGFIPDTNEARKFSDLEDAFFYSVQDQKERAEIKFHMQKEWRDMFSHFCVSTGQPVDADQWLSSVEELDRRVSMSRDAARRAKRKLMIGNALRQDGRNPDKGVFIDRSGVEATSIGVNRGANVAPETEEFLAALSEKAVFDDVLTTSANESSNKKVKAIKVPPNPSPFLSRALAYIIRYKVPFEHVDAWVPSFVPTQAESPEPANNGSSCRLCYAGCASAETQITVKGQPLQPMSPEDYFNLSAFGEYSQKFSFDVGCGLPGRVYQSGCPSWEQSVQHAPLHHFERCGGALEWGIKTVVGIPIASPTVGRLVIVLYSRFDREKDAELVSRLTEEFTKLLPTPTWKLVIDLGTPSIQNKAPEPETVNLPQNSHPSTEVRNDANQKDSQLTEIVSLLGEHMPSDTSGPMNSYVQGFMTLRLTLLRPQASWSEQDYEVIKIILGSYASYSNAGRTRKDIALLLARDYMFLMHSRSQQQAPPIVSNNNSPPVIAQHSYGGMPFETNMPSSGYYHHPRSPPVIRDSVSIISN